MFYMVLSRFVYALPLLIYGFLSRDALSSGDALTYSIFWLTLFLSSLFFFSLGKFSPALITHAVFIGEAYLLFRVGNATGDINWFLMILLSSFFAIEGLRNEPFQIFLHLAALGLVAFAISNLTNVGISSFMVNSSAPYILFSPLLCRGIVSAMESKDVVIKRIVQKTRVMVPMTDGEKLKQAVKDSKKTAATFKQYSDNLQKEVDRLAEENERLRRNAEKVHIENGLSDEIAVRYYALCAEPPADLSRPVDENITHILALSIKVLGSSYAAFIYKDGDDVYLSNSAGKNIDEDSFVEIFGSTIYKVIEKDKTDVVTGDAVKPFDADSVFFVPVSYGNTVKGVLVEAFLKGEAAKNAHYKTLCKTVACRLFSLLE